MKGYQHAMPCKLGIAGREGSRNGMGSWENKNLVMSCHTRLTPSVNHFLLLHTSCSYAYASTAMQQYSFHFITFILYACIWRFNLKNLQVIQEERILQSVQGDGKKFIVKLLKSYSTSRDVSPVTRNSVDEPACSHDHESLDNVKLKLKSIQKSSRSGQRQPRVAVVRRLSTINWMQKLCRWVANREQVNLAHCIPNFGL